MNPVLARGNRGPDVIELQRLLGINQDGDFGPNTELAVKRYQSKVGLDPDGIVGNMTWNSLRGRPIYQPKKLNLRWRNYPLENNEYARSIHPKKQVFLHHTSGGASAINVIDGWERDHKSDGSPYRVATSFVISREYKNYGQNLRDGELVMCFDPKYYAWHLGGSENSDLEPISIGIEICSWGGLTLNRSGEFTTWAGSKVPQNEVYEHHTEFRGYKYFQKYTDAQLNTLREVLNALKGGFGLDYQSWFDESWFEYHSEIRDGRYGIFTHTNVRHDKHDCFPQPELISMLNSL